MFANYSAIKAIEEHRYEKAPTASRRRIRKPRLARRKDQEEPTRQSPAVAPVKPASAAGQIS